MLSKLILNNFKCFQYNEMNLRPLTILVGGNGVGKSSIIQSILLAKQSIDKLSGEENPSNFEVKLNGPYLLNLGLAKSVLSSNADSPNIKLTLVNDLEEETKINYSFGGQYGEHLLEGSFEKKGNESYLPIRENFSYINAERLGPRQALSMGPSLNLEVGYKGDYTSHALFRADRTNQKVHDSLRIQKDSTRFSRQVEAWMSLIFPDLQLDYKVIEEVNMVSMTYKDETLDTEFFPAPNNGFGISYTLPIIVAGLILSSKENGALVIENPEAHLHPLGQSRMGRFLAAISLAGVQVIIETHSEHIINGARIEVAKNNKAKDFIVNFLDKEDKGVTIKELEVNEFGELTEWPAGFFDQEQKDIKELFQMKRRNKK